MLDVFWKFYQFISVTQSCPTLCNPVDYSTPGFPVHHQLPGSAQTHVSDAIQPSHPLSFSSCLQSFPASWSFPRSSLHQVAKVLEFQLQHQSFQWKFRTMISLRIDSFDLVAAQGTLKSLLQHHSSKASILLHSAFFIVQLSHPYMTTGNIIALSRQIFVGQVMSLLFNMLSRLDTAFLPRNKHLNFVAAVTICSDFGAPQNKVCFHCFPIYFPWSDGTRCHDLNFQNVEL